MMEVAALLIVNLAACLLIAPASCVLTGVTVGWFAQGLQIDAWFASGEWLYLLIAISLGSSAALMIFVGSLSWFNWTACKAWTTTKQGGVIWAVRFAYIPVFAVFLGVAWFLHRFFM